MNDIIENQVKQIRKGYKEIKEINPINLIIKIILLILLIILLSIFKLSFNSSIFELKIKKEKNILPIQYKNKIITIGFYDVIHCKKEWRRIKKGYFYELPKYINKFRWIFLAKNGVESKCNKYTHLKFRNANNFENLEKAVVKNKIDIIVQNEDENVKEHKYLLKLKKKLRHKISSNNA